MRRVLGPEARRNRFNARSNMNTLPIPAWVLATGGVTVSVLVPYCRVGAALVAACALSLALGFAWGQQKLRPRK